MTADASPRFALRPFLPADTPILAEIFRASISELTGDDYSEAQQEAWAAAADDEAVFGARLGKSLTLIATLEGRAVGFVSLEGKDKLDMLYVHPEAAGQGAGTMLVDALEKLASARGVGRLSVDASDTARDFFAARGYAPHQRNTVTLDGEWLSNTTMRKELAGKGKP